MKKTQANVWHVGKTRGWWIRGIICSDPLLRAHFVPACDEVTGQDGGRLNWSNWGRHGLCGGGCGNLEGQCSCGGGREGEEDTDMSEGDGGCNCQGERCMC